MFFIHQSWGIQTDIFETNIINLAYIFLVFSNKAGTCHKDRLGIFPACTSGAL